MSSTAPRVWVLGADGMLGQAVLRELNQQGFDVSGTSRRDSSMEALRTEDGYLDAERFLDTGQLPRIQKGEIVVNCIGVIRAKINPVSCESRLSALRINAEFPITLAMALKSRGARLIQIATDCVFSGRHGNRVESSEHDAEDVYGKTKSLGEPNFEGVLNIRCSIVGREPTGGGSLMEWVLSHKKGEVVEGFTNHLWNGVSTNAFARVVAGMVKFDEFVSGTYHLVPSDKLTKYELVALIAESFDRQDLAISPFETPQAKDMTLATSFPQMNDFFWERAGYKGVPTIRDLVKEVSNGC